ncbi:hypothetical protein IJ818_00635 [bacterium]|nr:hypothetical protein [bacterium]
MSSISGNLPQVKPQIKKEEDKAPINPKVETDKKPEIEEKKTKGLSNAGGGFIG